MGIQFRIMKELDDQLVEDEQWKMEAGKVLTDLA